MIEANPAASLLIGADVEEITGKPLAGLFEAGTLPAVQSYLAAIRAGGREPDVSAGLAARGRTGRHKPVLIRASLFRQANATLFLLRLAAPDANALPELPDVKAKLLAAVEGAPDGFVEMTPKPAPGTRVWPWASRWTAGSARPAWTWTCW